MPQAKSTFLKDKELRDWLAAIVKHDNWQRCLAVARSEMMETCDNMERIRGCRDFENILFNLPDPDEGFHSQYPTSGLNHNLDENPRRVVIEHKPSKTK